MSDPLIAYCGPAAVPEDIWTRWNADPLLIVVLAALAVVVRRGSVADARAGWGAIELMVLIFVSPLCALSSALFSARVLHHVLLIAAVAPPRRATTSRLFTQSPRRRGQESRAVT